MMKNLETAIVVMAPMLHFLKLLGRLIPRSP